MRSPNPYCVGIAGGTCSGKTTLARTVRPHAYDFTTHCRTDSTLELTPRPIILVEGILVLACPEIAPLLDLKVYIDEQADVRRERRMLRDARERGRTPEMSALQYERDVLPMHARYVEPGKNNADLLLSSSADTERLLCALRAVLAGDGCTSTR